MRNKKYMYRYITQEDLFNEMMTFSNRAQQLASYVQNDFDELLKGEHCEKIDIKYAMKNLQELFSSFVIDYQDTVSECLKYMDKKSN